MSGDKFISSQVPSTDASAEPVVYGFGDFRLHPVKRELWRSGKLIEVPARVFACLLYLIEHRERAVGRAEVIRTVWRRDNVSDTQLFQLILRARRIIGDEAERQQSIRTIVGFGYRWIAPTVLVEPDAVPVVAPEQPMNVQAIEAPSAPQAIADPPLEMLRPNPRSHTAWWGVAGFAVLIVSSVGIFLGMHRASQIEHRAAAVGDSIARVAVVPLRIAGADDSAWVRLGGMDLIASRLRRAGMAVLSSEASLGVVLNAQDDGVGKLRAVAGISLVVDGDVARNGSVWNVALQAAPADGAPLHASASDGDLLAAMRTATDKLLLMLGRSAPPDSTGSQQAEILQRARAALLADDAGKARTLLEQAQPSPRDASEVRLLMAQIDTRQGRFEVAERTLTSLLSELAGREDAYLRIRILIARGAARIPLDHLIDAKADFDAALDTPGANAFAHELGDAYVGRGATGTLRNDYAAAADDLGRARVLLSQSGDALAVARVDLELALLDSARGAAAQAAARFDQAARQFEAFGAIRPLKSALIGLQDVQVDQLQNAAALATSDRAWAISKASGDPLLARVLSLMRARILLANGRFRDLHALIAQIEAGDTSYLAASRDDERLRLLRTELALREGRSEDAAREASALPTLWLAGDADDSLRAKAALWRQRALPPTAAVPGTGIAPSGKTDAGSMNAAPLRRLAEAERAVALGRWSDADVAYREALRRAEDTNLPLTIAMVIESHAAALIERGQLADAAALVGRVGAWGENDYDCALLQLRLAHALGERNAWENALVNARRLAGERVIPAKLAEAPARIRANG